MIKLTTDLAELKGDLNIIGAWHGKVVRSALVAHAYQEAIEESPIFPLGNAKEWINNRAAELLKSYGVEE